MGRETTKFRVGDRVVAPFSTACGDCFQCRRGLPSRCERGSLFGWVPDGVGLAGGQAELVRVPLAASTLVAVPDGIPPEQALLAGDVLSTGWFGAKSAGVEPGATVAVVGCGAIGAVGVHHEPALAIPPGALYDKNLAYRAGRCPARALLPRALDLIASNRVPFGELISHRLPLAEAPSAYAAFDRRDKGWTKVVFRA